jgi:dipeptidyl-peptidase-4
MVREIHRFDNPEFDPSVNSRSEMVRIKTSVGLFDMPAILTFPLNLTRTRNIVVFTIYGGPNSKIVTGTVGWGKAHPGTHRMA